MPRHYCHPLVQRLLLMRLALLMIESLFLLQIRLQIGKPQPVLVSCISTLLRPTSIITHRTTIWQPPILWVCVAFESCVSYTIFVSLRSLASSGSHWQYANVNIHVIESCTRMGSEPTLGMETCHLTAMYFWAYAIGIYGAVSAGPSPHPPWGWW